MLQRSKKGIRSSAVAWLVAIAMLAILLPMGLFSVSGAATLPANLGVMGEVPGYGWYASAELGDNYVVAPAYNTPYSWNPAPWGDILGFRFGIGPHDAEGQLAPFDAPVGGPFYILITAIGPVTDFTGYDFDNVGANTGEIIPEGILLTIAAAGASSAEVRYPAAGGGNANIEFKLLEDRPGAGTPTDSPAPGATASPEPTVTLAPTASPMPAIPMNPAVIVDTDYGMAWKQALAAPPSPKTYEYVYKLAGIALSTVNTEFAGFSAEYGGKYIVYENFKNSQAADVLLSSLGTITKHEMYGVVITVDLAGNRLIFDCTNATDGSWKSLLVTDEINVPTVTFASLTNPNAGDNHFTFNVSATTEDPMAVAEYEFAISVDPATVAAGGDVEITVALDNYDDLSLEAIGGMSIAIDLDGAPLSYKAGSFASLAALDGSDACVGDMIGDEFVYYYVDGVGTGLARTVTDLFSFEVTIDDAAPAGDILLPITATVVYNVLEDVEVTPDDIAITVLASATEAPTAAPTAAPTVAPDLQGLVYLDVIENVTNNHGNAFNWTSATAAEKTVMAEFLTNYQDYVDSDAYEWFPYASALEFGGKGVAGFQIFRRNAGTSGMTVTVTLKAESQIGADCRIFGLMDFDPNSSAICEWPQDNVANSGNSAGSLWADSGSNDWLVLVWFADPVVPTPTIEITASPTAGTTDVTAAPTDAPTAPPTAAPMNLSFVAHCYGNVYTSDSTPAMAGLNVLVPVNDFGPVTLRVGALYMNPTRGVGFFGHESASFAFDDPKWIVINSIKVRNTEILAGLEDNGDAITFFESAGGANGGAYVPGVGIVWKITAGNRTDLLEIGSLCAAVGIVLPDSDPADFIINCGIFDENPAGPDPTASPSPDVTASPTVDPSTPTPTVDPGTPTESPTVEPSPTASPTVAPHEHGDNCVKLGDATLDGWDVDLDIDDILAVRDHMFGNEMLTGRALYAADTTKTGVIDIDVILAIRNDMFGIVETPIDCDYGNPTPGATDDLSGSAKEDALPGDEEDIGNGDIYKAEEDILD